MDPQQSQSQPQQQSQQSQQSTSTTTFSTGARPPAKKSIVSTMAEGVAAHAYLSLAVIVVLVILLIGTYVYYQGFLFLGPYAKGPRSKAAKGAKAEPGGAADAEKGDPETERLIESINSQ